MRWQRGRRHDQAFLVGDVQADRRNRDAGIGVAGAEQPQDLVLVILRGQHLDQGRRGDPEEVRTAGAMLRERGSGATRNTSDVTDQGLALWATMELN